MDVAETSFEPGLYPDVAAETYHQWECASQSTLKILRDRSPAHAHEQLHNPTDPTPALRLGAAIHTAVLQPEQFDTYFIEQPDINRRTKAGKKAWAEFVESAGDRTILTADENLTCGAVRDAVAQHPTARKLLEGEAERSAIWRDAETGVLCKGRFDDIARSVGALTDLKTARDASRDAFERAVWSYAYYIQAAHYLSGAQTLGLDLRFFTFIVVEKEPPYAVAVYHLRDDVIQAGADELRPLLETFARCQETDRWPGYPPEAQEISVPPWGWRRLEEAQLI